MILEDETGVTLPAATKAGRAAEQPMLASTDYEVVSKRNIFNSEEAPDVPVVLPGAKEKRADLDLSGPAVKTSLNIKVLGTMVVGKGVDSRSSATVVGSKKRKADVYFVGGKETFEEGVELVRVKKDRIEFINKGRLEYALLEGVLEKLTIFARAEDVHYKDQKGKGTGREREVRATERREEKSTAEEGDVLVIDQREIDEALANMDRLYTEIRIVPNFRDGRPAGLKVLAIKPGSIFSKLGLKRGDILERINGLELDIKRGMDLFGQLRDQKNLRIDLVRRGKSQTLEYEIK